MFIIGYSFKNCKYINVTAKIFIKTLTLQTNTVTRVYTNNGMFTIEINLYNETHFLPIHKSNMIPLVIYVP